MAAPHLAQSVRAGETVYTSGQLGYADGAIGGDIGAQTRRTLANLEAALAPHGLGLSDVVKTTVWLKRTEDFAAFNAAYADIFGAHKPARSTTICDLAVEEALVEIEATAVLRQRAVRRLRGFVCSLGAARVAGGGPGSSRRRAPGR